MRSVAIFSPVASKSKNTNGRVKCRFKMVMNYE